MVYRCPAGSAWREEDRFFSTVFLGSGLLFLAMLFTTAAIIAAIIFVFATEPNLMVNSATYRVTRAIAYVLMNVYAIKMAAVFMFFDFDSHSLHRSRATLGRFAGLRVGGDCFARWPKHHLEYFYFAHMGIPDQHLYSDR